MSKRSYQIIKLPDGLTLLLYPQKGLYSAAINLYIRTGPVFESSATLGLSHFAEHMIFKGTDSYPTVKALNDYHDEIGFHPAAYTAPDHVSVYGTCPKDNLSLALENLSEMVIASLFKDEAIEKERSVIAEEFLRRRDNPDVYLWDEAMKDRFLGKTAVIGKSLEETAKNVLSVDNSLVRNFYNKAYSPSRMILGVAGNFDISFVKSMVKKYFLARSKPDMIPEPKLSINDAAKAKIMRFEHAAGKVYLKLSWPIFADLKKMRVALAVGILGSVLGRRLFDVLYGELGSVYDISAKTFFVLNDIGIISIDTSFESSKLGLVMKTIKNVVDQLIKEGVSEIELKHHIQRINQTSPMSFDYLTSALNWLVSYFYFYNKIYLPNELIERRKKIRVSDIQNLVKNIFKSEYLHIAAIGPLTQKELENTL